ncbi:MAG: glycosyltransferase family 4 protein [Hyphomicrobiaceae bacterium]
MTRAPTILQVIPSLDTGGAELSTLEIASALVRVGGRALVATTGGRLADELVRRGGEIVPFPAASKSPLTLFANIGRLAELCRREGVALIHARSRAPAWSALAAARRLKLPFVTTYHGAYGNKEPFKDVYNSVMARGNLVIANSAYTARLIGERHRTPTGRIRVVNRGVDLAVFDPAAVSEARLDALRRDWGLSPDGKVILHAARLTGWKGQRVVVAAAAELLRTGHLGDAVIILAGDAQGRTGYADELESAVRAAGLAGRVKLVGHCADIAAAFRLAHVAVVASTEPEAFGRAATEAQAMACPVIATAIGAPAETVLAAPGVGVEERTGWLVPPGDAVALARALVEAMGLDGGGREALGMRARRHVAMRYSLEAMQLGTLAVYDELLGSGLAARFKAATDLGAHVPPSDPPS